MQYLKIEENKASLEGPFECQGCGGHIMFDATFLEQVKEELDCPYCGLKAHVPE